MKFTIRENHEVVHKQIAKYFRAEKVPDVWLTDWENNRPTNYVAFVKNKGGRDKETIQY